MAPLPLRELQTRLRALISDPRTLSTRDEDLAREIAALDIRGGNLPALDRVRIYGSMYFLRLRDALATDYAALRQALGEAAFDDLARRYVTAHPSDRPSLRDLGRHLPGFAYRQPPPVETWHAELAQLEWAMVDAFDAPDQRALSRVDLETLAPEAWPVLRLEPVRSLVLLACTFPVDALRERLLAGETVASAQPEAIFLRVWRQDLKVYVRRVPLLEMAALRWASCGCSFGDLCGWLAEVIAGGDPAAAATDLLVRWLDDGLLAAP